VDDARIDGGRRRRAPFGPLRRRLARHEALLWWLHSAYVLALGAGLVWLGARNFSWLRYSGFYLLAIWLLSLFLSNIVLPRDGAWWGRARVLVNYVNKNLYQQLLFFILPIYAGSTTWRSRNVVFLAALALSAVLSTMDLVYDRVLAARRALAAWFFAFNVFAVVGVALPVMFGIGAQRSARLATLAAAGGFVTLAWRLHRLRHATAWAGVVAGAALIVAVGEVGRPLVPPAPLRVMSTAFGSGLDRDTLTISGPLASLPPGFRGRLYAVTAVRAPLGLHDRVELRWYADSTLVSTSSRYTVSGGRREGYRLWGAVDLARTAQPRVLRLDVVTEGGQLVGRAELRAAR
jgi:Family of unknown function (DUF5924)